LFWLILEVDKRKNKRGGYNMAIYKGMVGMAELMASPEFCDWVDTLSDADLARPVEELYEEFKAQAPSN
jgi:hypothetical protein